MPAQTPLLLLRRADSAQAVLPWLQGLGVSAPGQAIMSPKGALVVVEIRHLPMPLAQILKQEALSAGADFATPKNAILLKDKHTHGLLVATRAQFTKLTEKMATQPLGGKALAARLKALTQPTRRPPQIMGVLNLTPDSFHDGGRFTTLKTQRARLEALREEGADYVDLGPMSSRPGAAPVSAAEQIRRLKPCLKHAVALFGPRVSVDTPLAEVAAFALQNGAGMVNDITALGDPKMAATAAKYHAELVLMHMQGTPQTMQQNPSYDDVTAEVLTALLLKAEAAAAAGVPPQKIWLDPGIGFGKTVDHNLTLLRELPALCAVGHPVLVGVSRKSFLGAIGAGDTPAQRLEGSLTAAVHALAQGATMVRVHDVLATRRAMATGVTLGMLPPC